MDSEHSNPLLSVLLNQAAQSTSARFAEADLADLTSTDTSQNQTFIVIVEDYLRHQTSIRHLRLIQTKRLQRAGIVLLG